MTGRNFLNLKKLRKLIQNVFLIKLAEIPNLIEIDIVVNLSPRFKIDYCISKVYILNKKCVENNGFNEVVFFHIFRVILVLLVFYNLIIFNRFLS